MYVVNSSHESVPPASFTTASGAIAAAAAVSSAGRDAGPVVDCVLVCERHGLVTAFRSPQLLQVAQLQLSLPGTVCCLSGAVGKDAQSLVVVAGDASGHVTRQVMPLASS